QLFILFSLFFSFFSTILPPPRSTLFPYTTLFRSRRYPHDRTQCCLRSPVPAGNGRISNACRRKLCRIRHLQSRNISSRLTARLRSEEHTSELQSRFDLVCRLLLEKKKKIKHQ